ncbi:MAG: phosphoglycerate dehydrogenase [Deltaproteobacteria bacterium]|nr:phosphoglycerate dehydrogenase [Deltaproteobacteria bacterium]
MSVAGNETRVLLLEGIHEAAVDSLSAAGYGNVERLAHCPTGSDLLDAIGDVDLIGIRSRTHLDAAALDAAKKLKAIGCFCIGTNQVDLDSARRMGIPVFNAPFSNTRSVAELAIADIILLMRGIPEKSARARRGEWAKTARNAYEVRGKCLGIVGYGRIGSQLGILAEGLGMRVLYYDVEHKLPFGNAAPVNSLDELLTEADVVSLHIPETPVTRNIIDADAMKAMRRGALLINAARGSVVDIEALAQALETGHIGGAAIDVFPVEPKSNQERFESPLREFDNVILTPHIGGATEEAQFNIAREVVAKLVKYNDNGSTASAVNFPQVTIPDHENRRRILHIHKNEPGVMEQINHVFSVNGVNVAAQYLETQGDVGYVVMDIELEDAGPLLDELRAISATIRVRVLH